MRFLYTLLIAAFAVGCAADKTPKPLSRDETVKALSQNLADLQRLLKGEKEITKSQMAEKLKGELFTISSKKPLDAYALPDLKSGIKFTTPADIPFKVWITGGDWNVVKEGDKLGFAKFDDLKATHKKYPVLQQGKSDINVLAEHSEANLETFFEKLVMDKINEITTVYKDNPYFRVSGFNVTLGVSPSATIRFDIK